MLASIPLNVLASGTPVFTTQNDLTPLQIQDLIVSTAHKNGLNADHFLAVAQCESLLDPRTQSYVETPKGPNGRENSWGLFQINLDAHPEVTYAEAIDPVWATNWAASEWREGLYREWSCWGILYDKGGLAVAKGVTQ